MHCDERTTPGWARAARHPRRPAIPRFVITDLATEAMTPPQTTTHGLLAPNKRLEAQQVKTLLPHATDVSSRPSPPRTTNRPARRAPSETRCRATMIPALSLPSRLQASSDRRSRRSPGREASARTSAGVALAFASKQARAEIHQNPRTEFAMGAVTTVRGRATVVAANCS